MACFIIGCRLSTPGRDYVELIQAIESLGLSWPCFDRAWLVHTDRSAAEIRDELKPFIDANDDLLVAELSRAAAWRGAAANFGEGLKRIFAAQRRPL